MFERTPPSRPTAGQPAFGPAAARMRGDQALARALALRRALDEFNRRRLAERSGAPAALPQPPRAGLPLHGAVGFGRENRPEDLTLARRRLAALGYAPALQTWQDLPFFDPLLETGLRAFQAGRGLPVDGWMRPGGETERALAAELAVRQAPPSVQTDAPKPPAAPQQPPRHLSGSLTDLFHRPDDPFAIDRDSLGRPLPSRPGAATASRTKDPHTPEGPQIAFGPALALPFLLGTGASGINWAALATILGVTGAAGLLASDTLLDPASGSARHPGRSSNSSSQRRQSSPLGPTPPFEPDLPPEDDGTESRPAKRVEPTILPGGLEGVEFPHTTQIPIPDDDLPRIFAFPGDPSEFPQIDIVERKGNALTKAEIDQIRDQILISNPGWEHKWGGRNQKTGNEMSEYRVPGWGSLFKDKKGRPGDSRPGSFFTDLTFETPDGRIVHVQHADVDGDGNIREYEWEKANTIRDHTGHDVILIGKKWQQRN